MAEDSFSRESLEYLLGEVSAQGCIILHIVRMFNGKNDSLDFKQETLDFIETLETYYQDKYAEEDPRFPLHRLRGATKMCDLVRNNLER